MEISRLTYPSLWQWVQTQTGLLIDENDWVIEKNNNGECGFYSTGDGLNTFRLPLINSFARAKGNSLRSVGEFEGDAIRKITGETGIETDLGEPTGAFYKGDIKYGQAIGVLTNDNMLSFDVSRVVPTAEENRPKNITFLYCVKAFYEIVDEELVDITQFANDMANIANKTDFTIIYPNVGTEEDPAEVEYNNRYVENNPFPGCMVICQAEILLDGKWGITGWLSNASGVLVGYGVNAGQLLSDDTIIIQTGSNSVMTNSACAGGIHGINLGNIYKAPCRVKIWKVK